MQDFPLKQYVEATDSFVQHHNSRGPDNRSRYAGPLLLATRQLVRVPSCVLIAQSNRSQRAPHPFPAF
jgi:hypothetical protein